jgi:Spy/CpxP family protein refolding chaperone
MKRFVLTSGLAAVAFAAMTLSAFADDGPGLGRAGHGRGGHGLMKLRHCLANLNLPSDQQASIQAILDAAKPGLQAAAETVKADRAQLKKDLESGADKGVVGQDVINAHADRGKLRAAMDAVRDQVLAKLSTDQQASLKDCAQASGGSRRPGPAGFRGGQ